MTNKIIILTGPTGIGKTSHSIKLAKALDTEIISCDSFQIYKGMDIGTAKVRQDEMDNIIHHNIDIVYPDQDFNVSKFKDRTEDIIKNMQNKSKIPILVGGTGLYIHSLIYDLDFGIKADPSLRKDIEKMIESDGLDSLYNKLIDLDPKLKDILQKNNRHRIIRAYEIYLKTGEAPSSYLGNFRKPEKKYDFLYIVLNEDREKLYKNINKRVDQMINSGLVEEINDLLDRSYSFDLRSFKAIGYREFGPYFSGDQDLKTTTDQIKKNTRNYAKRQLTWFRREERAVWVDKDDFKSPNDLDEYILNLCQEFINE